MAYSQIYHRPEWRRVRRVILDRDGYRCRACGKAGILEVDHRIPLRAGGAPYDPDNLQALCRGCHFAKTAAEQPGRQPRTLEQRRYRALVEELI